MTLEGSHIGKATFCTTLLLRLLARTWGVFLQCWGSLLFLRFIPQSKCLGAPWKVVACVWNELPQLLDKIMWSGSCYISDRFFWQACVAGDVLYFCGNSINREDSLCTRDSLISDYCDVLLVVHCSALRVSGFISCDSEVVCTDVRTTFPPSLHCWHGGLQDSKVRDARGHGVCIHTTAPLLQLSFCT